MGTVTQAPSYFKVSLSILIIVIETHEKLKCDTNLLYVSVRGLPHIIIFYYTLETFPGKEVLSDVIEVFAVLVQSFFKEICFRR